MRLTCLFVICALAVSLAASAATVNLTSDNLVANGWKATATSVYGGTTNAYVTQTNDYGASNFRFFTGSMFTSWQFQWAGISTNAYSGLTLASISSVKIRNYGAYGDNAVSWQPPTFTWVVDKGDGNQRCVSWKPWTNGNAREAGVWHEYDAAVTGQWLVAETETLYNSLAALKAALPNAFFADTANLPVDWGYVSQNGFNVGNCPLYDADRGWFSGVSGYVDWFEIGVIGNVTRYDLGAAVPEPGCLAAMGVGLLGLLGMVKRRK